MSESTFLQAVAERIQTYTGFLTGNVRVNDWTVLQQDLDQAPFGLVTSQLALDARPLVGRKIQANWTCQATIYVAYRDETQATTALQTLMDGVIVTLLEKPGLELSPPNHGTIVISSLVGQASYDDIFLQPGDDYPLLRGRGLTVSARELISLP